ncbi:MAG: valine--tRNA ligase [Phycisphaerales bacterium]
MRIRRSPSPDAASEPSSAAAGAAAQGLDKQYKPQDHEARVRARWEGAKAGAASAAPVLEGKKKPYTIFIPPPNVTDRLHLGHALNNTLQDVLARVHRMRGFETLWMPGTDHAGIATQTMVEKRVLKETGRRRTDFPRDEFVARIQAFKDEYEATITGQLRAMGCSCDWDRQRFTMDPICTKAVREAFFRLFRDGLIYRGKRLVNWDPVTQTALADDEVEMEEVDGFFYYLRYPIVRGGDGTPVRWGDLATRGYAGAGAQPADTQAWVTVATTRPETYLGDTAVALNPKDPRAAALRGLSVRLPLVGRVIPIIEDDYVVMAAANPDAEGVDVKAKYATGFLKVTPAHDPNDYDIGVRHKLPVINVMAPDASISGLHGWSDIGEARQFVGMGRELARREVLNQFSRHGLLEAKKPYRHSVGHSYRSHAPIEPYLSDQWYVRTTDDRFAGAALRAMVPDQRARSVSDGPAAPHDGGLRFFPERYGKTFQHWHENIRDWCVSRQLWWGHRICVWSFTPDLLAIKKGEMLEDSPEVEREFLASTLAHLRAFVAAAGIEGDIHIDSSLPNLWRVCARNDRAVSALTALEQFWQRWQAGELGPADAAIGAAHDAAGLGAASGAARALVRHMQLIEQDHDVLDTWFSSALWPMSTLAWPERTPELAAFNPSSALCTAREIITLWVSRMVMFNRYFRAQDAGQAPGTGALPFKDVFIHAMIQDEQGRKMSKSLGNGVDPLDIIATHGADALRFTLCHMTTQTQDVRMPVVKDEATGRNTSPKFDLGRNFCNKLWNASRFAMGMLAPPAPGGFVPAAPDGDQLTLTDRWMLSRLARGIGACDKALASYEYSTYAQTLYELLWNDLCDWYLEAIKPTVAARPAQQAVLRTAIDVLLRLMHPMMPHVTETIWEHFRLLTGPRAKGFALTDNELLCRCSWPIADAALLSDESEAEFEQVRALVAAVREARANHHVQPRQRVVLHAPAPMISRLQPSLGVVQTLAGLARIEPEPPASGEAAVSIALGAFELKLSSLHAAIDVDAEKARLAKLVAEREREISALEGRLNNPGYADRAPAKLVEQSRQQLAQKAAERDAARVALEKLG